MAHLRKPEWLKVEIGGTRCGKVGRVLDKFALNTVCEQAGCPNRGECFRSGTATFMLLGNHCTRHCAFCNVEHSQPEPVCPAEPENVARAAAELGLRHVVVTSVTRDDLGDGGAGHFAATVGAVRNRNPGAVIEVLIPDFQGDGRALQTVLDSKPDILNHNVETVPELYRDIRPEAQFSRSLELLSRVKERASGIFTKSGFMLGLGEEGTQVVSLLKSLRVAGCDIVTIGQYLQPSSSHFPVKEYVHPEQFEKYKNIALDIGIPCVASGPLVRSSYHAEEDFSKLVRGAEASQIHGSAHI